MTLPLAIVRDGNTVAIGRADGRGEVLLLTVEEWRTWLAEVRLLDLDPDRLERS